MDELNKMLSEGELSAKTIYNKAYERNPLALETVHQASFYNIIGFTNIVQLYDPSLITVGGSVALNNPSFVIKPLENIREYIINKPPEIILTPLRGDIVLYGAAALALGLEEL